MAGRPIIGSQTAPWANSVGNGLLDQFGHFDDEIGLILIWVDGCADLADADADDIVQPVVRLAVGKVKAAPTI